MAVSLATVLVVCLACVTFVHAGRYAVCEIVKVHCTLVQLLWRYLWLHQRTTFFADSDRSIVKIISSLMYGFEQYATIHYEGTPKDDEYVLAIRVCC